MTVLALILFTHIFRIVLCRARRLCENVESWKVGAERYGVKRPLCFENISRAKWGKNAHTRRIYLHCKKLMHIYSNSYCRNTVFLTVDD